MIENAVERLLEEKIGLDPRSIARKTLCRVIRERMHACGLEDGSDYLSLASANPEELDCLIDSLVVPETWFFRDIEPFAFLKKHVLENRPAPGADHPLRILSLPSSTGEEPYSIAITLLDAGLKPGDFSIDAVDVSRNALRKAVRATYTAYSFREKNADYRGYFCRVEEGYRPIPEVCGAVRFIHGNVLAHGNLTVQGPYDVVFFRNLLIYLEERARTRAIRVIDGLLAEGGVLFLGYAEFPRLFFPGYLSVNHTRAYAVRKPEVGGQKSEVRDQRSEIRGQRSKVRDQRPEVRDRRVGGRRQEIGGAKPSGTPAQRGKRPRVPESSPQALPVRLPDGQPPAEQQEPVLERARGLADQGNLSMAAKLCSDHLKTYPACADAHFLLGVIALAGGDEEQALQSFHKAVYLEQSHADALIHVSLLLEKKGLHEQAKRYRRRAHLSNEKNV